MSQFTNWTKILLNKEFTVENATNKYCQQVTDISKMHNGD